MDPVVGQSAPQVASTPQAESNAPQLTGEGDVLIDLTQTPNEMPLLPAAVYDFVVDDAAIAPNGANTGYNIEVHLRVNDGPQKDKKMRDWIPLSRDNADNVKARQYALASNGAVQSGPFRPSTTKGKIVRASVIHRVDRNDKTKFYANIDKYIVPPDVLTANPSQYRPPGAATAVA